ncbi:MAG: SWIM zinc finger family protein, partial [Ilumatobacteraceae bacterium]
MTATVLHLPTARSISNLDVATMADSRTYARGVEYLRRGRVDVVELLDHAVTATVAGATPYVVRLAVGRRGVEHRCSCPVGDEGAFCKHLVAVALAVASLTVDDAATDDADPADVRAALAGLDKDELVGLLASAASEHPALGARLERRLAHGGAADRPVDLAGYRRAIDDGELWEERAHRVIDEVEAVLRAGQVGEVLDFCRQAADYLEQSAPEIADDDALGRLARRLDALSADATRRAAT